MAKRDRQYACAKDFVREAIARLNGAPPDEATVEAVALKVMRAVPPFGRQALETKKPASAAAGRAG